MLEKRSHYELRKAEQFSRTCDSCDAAMTSSFPSRDRCTMQQFVTFFAVAIHGLCVNDVRRLFFSQPSTLPKHCSGPVGTSGGQSRGVSSCVGYRRSFSNRHWLYIVFNSLDKSRVWLPIVHLFVLLLHVRMVGKSDVEIRL